MSEDLHLAPLDSEGSEAAFVPEVHPAGELRRLVDLCASGALRPLIGAVHPLPDVARAVREMVAGETRGKIVIDLADSG